MVGILWSGNFASLNHLTILPALACLDDACWPRWLQKLRVKQQIDPKGITKACSSLYIRRIVHTGLLCTIMYLSWPVVTNLWGHQGQVMNRSFDSFRIVNTYGAFGSVGTERYEAIISVTSESGTSEEWKELEFPCKPGRIDRRPCFCAPYQCRLDWNIWFL